jgi:hypothetical protein
MHYFRLKMYWATTLWAIFSQAHQVTHILRFDIEFQIVEVQIVDFKM